MSILSFLHALRVLAYEILLTFLSSFIPLRLNIIPQQNILVITGCDSGFGQLMSIAMSKLGYVVLSGCLTEAGVKSLQGQVTQAILCDVTKQKDIDALVEAAVRLEQSRGARIWAVFNNAGISSGGLMDWCSMESCRRVMEVNYFAVVAVTKAFLPLLKKTRGSRIINTSSLAAYLFLPTMGAYVASKHAVEGYAKVLRQELLPWGIHVVNINPGFTRTPIITSGCEQMFREYERAPEDIKIQYEIENLRPMSDYIIKAAVPPEGVVETAISNLTLLRPRIFNPIGKEGLISRMLIALPQGMQYILEVFENLMVDVGPKPEAKYAIQGVRG